MCRGLISAAHNKGHLARRGWFVKSAAILALVLGGPVVAQAQRLMPCPPCPCPAPNQGMPTLQAAPATPETAATPTAPGAAAAPGTTAAPGGAAPANQPAPDLLAQSAANEAAASESFTPGMIGDFFYAGVPAQTSASLIAPVPTPSAGILGRDKMADNNSPLPQDRVILDYSFFHDAALGVPFEVNRFTPGFEKTFFDCSMSVEMLFPMGTSLAPTYSAADGIYPYATQFGNMQIIGKMILEQTCTSTLVGGIGVSVPTAPDSTLTFAGAPLLTVHNNAVHLMPYIGLLIANPCSDWFSEAYVQVDVPTNGDSVDFAVPLRNGVVVPKVVDQTLLYGDVMLGRWLTRNPCNGTGLAAVVEAHYTGVVNQPCWYLSSTGPVPVSAFRNAGGTVPSTFVDVTAGLTYKLGKSSLTVGYGTPVTTDRGFDSEIRVLLNRYF